MNLAHSTEADEPPRLAIHRVRTFVGLCFGLFAMVAVLTAVVLNVYPAAHSSDHHLVATFSGEDNGTVGPFTVEDEWEFRWSHTGQMERFVWTRADGAQDELMAMPGKPIRSRGGVNYAAGGEYMLEVRGRGNWTIDIYQF